MKYTYDTIPAKLYFQIMETMDASVLGENGEEIISEINLKRNGENGGQLSHEMNLHAQIETLSARYKSIKLAVHYLKNKEDEEVINTLKEKGYKFSGNLTEDLKKIEKLSDGILVRIETIKNRLPKKEEQTNRQSSLDEVILSYCAILEMGFVDTNKVTLSQYDSIIKLGNNRMEALTKAEKVKDGRK